VKGYTDSRGSAAYNKRLSKMRAFAVRTKLIQLGVNPEKIRAEGYGEENPVASNDTKEGRFENRRVVIELERN
jgi:OOP family OmpA-OmpF porin